MKPKQVKKGPSERTRNLRHGPLLDKESAADPQTDGKSRVNAQVAALALRTASASGISKPKVKTLSSKQRKRREQMLIKGSTFSEKLSKKAMDTELSQKNVKQRAQDWEQVNEKAIAELLETDEREAKKTRVEG